MKKPLVDVMIDGDSFFDIVIHSPNRKVFTPEETADAVWNYITRTTNWAFRGKEFLIALSPEKSFRNKLFIDYKKNRPKRSEDKKETMKVFLEKYGFCTMMHEDYEADDIVMFYGNRGSKIIAIDKDILGVNKVEAYNFKKKEYVEPKTEAGAEFAMLVQSLMGDSSDGIVGAKGIGKAKAKQIVLQMEEPYDWVKHFKTLEDAVLQMRLVRMDQIDDNLKLKLWNIEDFKLPRLMKGKY